MKDSSFTWTSKKVAKSSKVAHALGTLDEANAFIGLARVFSKKNETKEILRIVQKSFSKACAHVAGYDGFDDENLKFLDEQISKLEKSVEIPKKFLILEKDDVTAFLSVARTIVRRAERVVVDAHFEGFVNKNLVDWLNKLGYLLYLLILFEGEEFEEV
ncbi:MAG: ATP:cob(I)alamin adenosyltransferase [Archaeoglobaceae archaeon]|nr:ATP:cob(I)alamin adenosyltransferase [Archaeoglobaceae archaeon]MCX8152308.1 ATP:cob(I)alamin adenosyltransferase [Archaeoglobaceae archaeon]MDW8013986.1 ATP:cob(I)alamin adenosyltransferase [Archaeoglobaceae archaeon]